jgi:hypothetical protein
MLAVVVFGAVFLLAPSLQDAYIGALRHPDERLGLTSAQGFFIGPGSYSWFAAATFAVCYAAYLAYQRHAYLVCAMVAGLFTALSWRRKSILAVLGMIFIALVLRSRRGTRSRALALILLTALVGVTVFAPYAIGLWSNTVREYGRADPFATARTALYYTSVLIARDHFPLGTGLASFGSHASKLYYSPIYEEYGLSQMWGLSPQTPFFITDTYWPMVLAEGGAVTLLFYWSFMALVYRRTWSIARAPAQSADHAFLTFCALFLLTGSVLESTASHFYGASLQATLALLPAGILLGRTLATTARSSADGQT